MSLIDEIKNGRKNLREADLSEADLSGVNLQEADLQGVNFQWANLQEADLQEADLQGANFQWANLQEADLQGANLQGANLQGANFQWANLQGANFQWANLQGVKLQGANFQWANLQGVKLQGANLRRADLQRADLQQADLTKTCLDPINETNQPEDFEIIDNGKWAIGYRTKTSPYLKADDYKIGQLRTAPYFSTSETPCHPGIYVCPTKSEVLEFGQHIVKVIFRPWDCHKAGNKYRVRELIVWEDVK